MPVPALTWTEVRERSLRFATALFSIDYGEHAEHLRSCGTHRRDRVVAEPHAVERAGGEVLDQHVAGLDQPLDDLLALLVLGVDGDRALGVDFAVQFERVVTHLDHEGFALAVQFEILWHSP